MFTDSAGLHNNIAKISTKLLTCVGKETTKYSRFVGKNLRISPQISNIIFYSLLRMYLRQRPMYK